eukprot:6193980-Pleurochrysis_carterae.AAC.5
MTAASGQLLRLSDVGIDERTITKTIAKINQFNFERDLIHQYSENERRLRFLSMIPYLVHLATKAQEELKRHQ